EKAAKAIVDQLRAEAAVVTGGHFNKQPIDVLYDGETLHIFHQNISTLIIHMEQAAHFPPLSQPNWQKANRLSNPWRLLKVLLLMPFNTVLSSGKETGRPIIGGIVCKVYHTLKRRF